MDWSNYSDDTPEDEQEVLYEKRRAEMEEQNLAVQARQDTTI